jgi:hypothetical protein
MAALEITGSIKRVDLGALAWLQALFLAMTCAEVLLRRCRSLANSAHTTLVVTPLPRYLQLSVAILAASYLLFAVNLFTSYPGGPDALEYHMPLALHWLQEGSLRIPASRVWQFSFPGNAEIGMMLLLGTGRQSLVPLVNWMGAAALGCAVYLIAQCLSRGNRLASFTAALIVFSIPMTEFQMFSGYIDLFGTGFLMAAIALFLSRYGGHAAESIQDQGLWIPLIALSALACGICMGSKSTYYVYGGVFLLIAVGTLVWERSRHRRSVVALVAVLALASLLPCAFWFGRGLAAERNPVYPLQVKLAGHVIFPGYAPSDIAPSDYGSNFVKSEPEWLLYPWTEWKRSPGYLLIPYSVGDGLGAAFATFVPLAVALALYTGFFRRRSGAVQTILLLAWLVLLAVWWLAMSQVPRYGLPLLIVACTLAAPLLAKLQTWNSPIFRILVVASILSTCIISSFMPIYALAGRILTGTWTRAEFYGYPSIIDGLPAGSRVLNYTGMPNVNFFLAGERLSNRVLPSFEAPPRLTSEFCRENNLDYVVEMTPAGNQVRPLELAGASLAEIHIDREMRWRIWKLNRPTARE